MRTHVLRDVGRLLQPLPAPWSSRLESPLRKLASRALVQGRSYDLIYANTVSAWRLVEGVADLAPSLLWHIHEMSYALAREMPSDTARALFPRVGRFVAVSDPVREAIVSEYSANAERVMVIPGFVDVWSTTDKDRKEARTKLLAEFEWPADSFVVGGCGALGWRKGTDLFLQIARAVCASPDGDRARFVWVGGGGGRDALEFTHDLRALGLTNRCAHIPHNAQVLPFYRAMDAFALTSREDPFPLVMLEAGASGVPTICFSRSGGAVQFVGSDAGLVASPPQDIPSFATQILRLMRDPALLSTLGRGAASKVRHIYHADVQAVRLQEAIVELTRQV